MEKEILYRYFEGRVTPDEEIAVREWAESSPENYKSYLEARKVWCALLLYAKPTTSSKTMFAGRVPLRYFAGFTAAVALLVGIVTLGCMALYSYSGGVQQISVPRGQRVEMTLADGSRIWLNSKSKLEYSPLFGLFNRNVRLSGEGYFEVAKGSKPFIVTTQNYDVKVHGTTFNVYAFDNNPIFEASLIEGSVEVIPHNGSSSLLLSSNQRAFSMGDGVLACHPLEDKERLRWIDGMICLNNVTFSEFVECFSNYFDTDIKILNPELYNQRFTGKFRQSDGIDYSLRVIQNLVKFDYSHDTRNHIIEIY